MAEAPVTQKLDSSPTISFKTTLFKIGTWTILRLPESASAKLPSRGQVMVDGTINGYELHTPLEPDGNWGHWLRVDENLQKAIHAEAGNTVSLSIKLAKNWPEPDVPADLMNAIKADPEVLGIWQDITPMARWEWIRWTRSTNSAETHQRRIEAACSKMLSGTRRPCCWNRNMCTEPSVSKNGVLLAPSPTTK